MGVGEQLGGVAIVWQERMVAWSRWTAWEPKEEGKVRNLWGAKPVGLTSDPLEGVRERCPSGWCV